MRNGQGESFLIPMGVRHVTKTADTQRLMPVTAQRDRTIIQYHCIVLAVRNTSELRRSVRASSIENSLSPTLLFSPQGEPVDLPGDRQLLPLNPVSWETD